MSHVLKFNMFEISDSIAWMQKTFCKLKRKTPEAIAASPIDDVIEIKEKKLGIGSKKKQLSPRLNQITQAFFTKLLMFSELNKMQQ